VRALLEKKQSIVANAIGVAMNLITIVIGLITASAKATTNFSLLLSVCFGYTSLSLQQLSAMLFGSVK
jgi:hypothetical protein